MKHLIIISLLVNLLFSLETTIENKPKENIKLETNLKKTRFFGEKLFQGKFKENQQLRHNENYLLNINDKISIKMWGGYNFIDDNLTIDKQGNIFIPEVGAVQLLGLPLSKLQSKVEKQVRKTFNKNVQVYTNVQSYQHISVFVTGAVKNIGLYTGLSSDSILQFIDKSGGLAKGEGSYRNIDILRNNTVIKNIDLYSFLLNGYVNTFQFQHGDVILVNPIKDFISVTGAVQRPYIFELLHEGTTVQEILPYILTKPTTNNFLITTLKGSKQITKEFSLTDASTVQLHRGDEIQFFSNYYSENIEITIEGEHTGKKHITMPKGTTLYKLLSSIKFTPLSNIDAVQLYRKSVADIQNKLVAIKLNDLEKRVLTNPSSTSEEAKIRQSEAAMVLNFIERARNVKQKGQVVLREEDNLNRIILEHQDRIVIPAVSNVVTLQGEVFIPNALAHREGSTVNDYIKESGGFTEYADEDKILLIKANGQVSHSKDSFMSSTQVDAGDSILVLREIETKNILLFKDITQILYQIAIGAAVVLQF